LTFLRHLNPGRSRPGLPGTFPPQGREMSRSNSVHFSKSTYPSLTDEGGHLMSQRITISNHSKLYLNFLSELQQVAAHFESHITVRKGTLVVDAKSFLEILGLIEAKGGQLEIVAEGEDAKEAVGAIRDLAIRNYLKLNPDISPRHN
jgi:phosphotransferase system HPr (HPr) family protein